MVKKSQVRLSRITAKVPVPTVKKVSPGRTDKNYEPFIEFNQVVKVTLLGSFALGLGVIFGAIPLSFLIGFIGGMAILVFGTRIDYFDPNDAR